MERIKRWWDLIYENAPSLAESFLLGILDGIWDLLKLGLGLLALLGLLVLILS